MLTIRDLGLSTLIVNSGRAPNFRRFDAACVVGQRSDHSRVKAERLEWGIAGDWIGTRQETEATQASPPRSHASQWADHFRLKKSLRVRV